MFGFFKSSDDQDDTRWVRQDFDGSEERQTEKQRKWRERARLETEWDLKKCIQQLVCDAQENGLNDDPPEQRLIDINRRLVSIFGRVALQHKRVDRALEVLTRRIVYLTWVLVILTVVLVYLEVRHH